jgi:PHD/YefM family antitoxin component YafN of YafNO toxin-antitoxin module
MLSQKEKRKKVIDKIGKTPVVVLPLDYFENMKEELEILSSKKLVNEIAKARQEVQIGEILSVSEVKRKLLLDK